MTVRTTEAVARNNEAWDEFEKDTTTDPFDACESWTDIQVFRLTSDPEVYILHILLGSGHHVTYDARFPRTAEHYYCREDGDLRESWCQRVGSDLEWAFDQLAEAYGSAS